MLSTRAVAQDQNQQDDPPIRVARLGYMEGSVSFQPAGETDWVEAVGNRPVTTGDKVWADKGSRAELQLGSAVIRLSANTGISFLNLTDHTMQLQLSSGSINVRVLRLGRDDVFEVDTPNLAFSLYQPGSYRLEASEDGTHTVVNIRAGDGEATGNGQTYTLHAGQRGTFSGTDSLNANVEQIGGSDEFDNWTDRRDRRHDDSRSARYVSRDLVGYEDLDDNGDWREDPNYGYVWFPNQTPVGWAPYRQGHWDWIDPWGYTWIDDSSWGYAPFHYGRWVTVGGRWGWVSGPPAEEPVYAPALVVFIGGGGAGSGGNVGWFPLGPREVYVPSYPVSRGYMNHVNISNTTVNSTTITNVYNTTIVNNSTNITNVTYVNRSVQGAVTAVPQRAFASAQPVARAAVTMSAQQIAAAPVTPRVAVAPTQQAVLGVKAATANRVTAPPAAVMNRQVIAKATPPPPPVPFAKQQQAMAVHPGVPLALHEMQALRPTTTPASPPTVKQAPPGKPATPAITPLSSQPTNKPASSPTSQPASRPGNPPANPNNASPTSHADRPPTPPNQSRPGTPPATTNPPSPLPNNGNPTENKPVTPNTAQPSNRPADRSTQRPVDSNNASQPTYRPAPVTQTPAGNPPAVNDHPPGPSNNPNRTENKPVTPNTVPPSSNHQADRSTSPPVNSNNPAQAMRTDRPAPPQGAHPNEIPVPPRPVIQPSANAELDKKHQQEQDQLRARQQEERQSVQQQQEQDHAKLVQQHADMAKKQQIEEQHQQQTQQLQHKHAEEQKLLQEKQQQERQNHPNPN